MKKQSIMCKRSISILLAAMMIMVISACGGNNSATSVSSDAQSSVASTSTDSASQQPADEDDASKPEVTLTRWVTANMQTEADLRQEARFLEKYPYIKLNNVMITEGMDHITAFAAGTNPDIGNVGQPDMAKFAYAGMARPLDDFFAAWDETSYFSKEALQNFQYGGKQYAMPRYSYTMNLFYNKRLFEEAGITKVPATWDELLETAKILTVPEKQQWGFNLLISQWTEWWFEYFVWQAGGDLTVENSDGTVELTFDDPAVETAIEFYRSLIEAKVVQPDLTLDYGNMQSEFSAGHAAMTLNGCDGIGAFTNQGMDINDIGMALLPAGPTGKVVTQLGGQCYFIFSNVDDDVADAAWKFIAFELGKEEQIIKLEESAETGNTNPYVMVRTDIDTSIGKINPEFQKAVDDSIPFVRLEFYGKGIVGPYIDTAVQKTALDSSADIKAIFAIQQELAQKEAADKFNQDILNP